MSRKPRRTPSGSASTRSSGAARSCAFAGRSTRPSSSRTRSPDGSRCGPRASASCSWTADPTSSSRAPGCTARWTATPCSRGRSAPDPAGRSEAADRISGTVVRVLDRARERVVGRFEKHDGRAQVSSLRPPDRRDRPDRRREDPRRPGRRDRRGPDNGLPRRPPHCPRRRRGAPGIPGRAGRRRRDRPALARTSAPVSRSPSSRRPSAIPRGCSTEDLLGRRDFRDRRIVTIDGETAKDFDDAVEVEKTPTGLPAGRAHRRRLALRPGGDRARRRGAVPRARASTSRAASCRCFPRSSRTASAR